VDVCCGRSLVRRSLFRRSLVSRRSVLVFHGLDLAAEDAHRLPEAASETGELGRTEKEYDDDEDDE
jgi:hypothetical protein